jgi:hypothetical protein
MSASGSGAALDRAATFHVKRNDGAAIFFPRGEPDYFLAIGAPV